MTGGRREHWPADLVYRLWGIGLANDVGHYFLWRGSLTYKKGKGLIA